MNALIFANGEIEDGAMVQRALAQAGDALMVAADGGVRAAAHFRRRVQTVIGDMDSLTPEELDTLSRTAGADLASSRREGRNRS